MEAKKSILISFLIQIIVLITLFFGWLIGFELEKGGLVLSVVIYVFVLILFFFLKKYGRSVHIVTIITSLATGILIGSFISKYSTDVGLVLKVMAGVGGIVLLVHGLLLIIPYHKTVVGILIFLLFIGIVIGFTMFEDVLIKEMTLLGINYMFTLIGLLAYFIAGEDMDLYLAGSLLWAFIIIFIIIIIILSEGDALSGFDIGDAGGTGKKRKKGR